MVSSAFSADMPDEMVGPRVKVRPYRSGDGLAVFEAIDESRDHILPWMPWGPNHMNVDDSELFARRCATNWDNRTDLSVGFWEAATSRYLGGSGLHRIRWEVPAFEIGYWVRKSAEGQGFVTETVQLLCGLAFDRLDAARVFIRCAVSNMRSAAIPRRLGFREEGVLRNEIRDAAGDLHDAHVFSMLPGEWADRRPSFILF